MLHKTWFSFLYLFSNVELELIHFIQHNLQQQKPPEVLNLKIEILLGFQKAVNGEIIVVWLKPLEFVLISPCKTSLRPVLKTCLGKISWRYLEDVFSATTFRLPRRLQAVFKTSWGRLQKRKICYPKDVLKRSWRSTNVCWVRMPQELPNDLSRILKDQKSLGKSQHFMEF